MTRLHQPVGQLGHIKWHRTGTLIRTESSQCHLVAGMCGVPAGLWQRLQQSPPGQAAGGAGSTLGRYSQEMFLIPRPLQHTLEQLLHHFMCSQSCRVLNHLWKTSSAACELQNDEKHTLRGGKPPSKSQKPSRQKMWLVLEAWHMAPQWGASAFLNWKKLGFDLTKLWVYENCILSMQCSRSLCAVLTLH